MKPIRIAGETVHIPSVIAVFIAGFAGGEIAHFIGAPLPMMLGSIVVVGAMAVFGVRPFGQPLRVPQKLRACFVPVIGLSVGANFTPGILEEARGWWPSLLSLLIYIPLAHFVGYQTFRRLGGLPPVTAYFGSVPGGLIESVTLGEQHGANVQMLAALQFMRLILSLMLVPLAFSILNGGAVGSAAGVVMSAARAPFTAEEAFWQTILAVIGFFGGRRLNMPAYLVTGPILASGLGHLSGLLEAAPPWWLIQATQLVIGVTLGARFADMPVRDFGRALKLALTNIVFTLILAVIAALVLHQIVGERVEAVILAFAPGGLAEMSLVALSMHISALYVSTHHVARIVLAITVARLFSSRIPPEA